MSDRRTAGGLGAGAATTPVEDVTPGLLEGITIAPPPPAHEPMGFFTDATLCIGCKACEVACKQWNALPADGMAWTGRSYDNTTHLSATTWRHVSFTEQALPDGGVRWLFKSDVCKHCAHAGCLEACPTGAIIRTEFNTVVIQEDVCNGCGYCIPACPFGVLGRSKSDGAAHKCTLCYDRQKDGMEPACAKACPTDSIQFGPVSQLRERARRRLGDLHERGKTNAYLYGEDDAGQYKRLNAFFLLEDEPAAYNLPPAPRRPTTLMVRRYLWSAAVGLGLTVAGAVALAGAKGEV
ncbi:MAG: 4Fe-4S dicluster domain-containing protein [Chloroflexota bacterium]